MEIQKQLLITGGGRVKIELNRTVEDHSKLTVEANSFFKSSQNLFCWTYEKVT